MRIGLPCPELAALHRTHHATCSAFITACNPCSHPLDPAANANRHKALAAELTRRALPFLEGIGQHPSNQWPGEPSYLVFQLPLAAAKTLGHDLEQNAIVRTGEDAIPQLVLLR